LNADWDELFKVTNENFDLRRTIMNIPAENMRMVEAAREVGASAHFAGSGGAITGLYHSGGQYQKLVDALDAVGCTVLRPLIFET
jgi:glucuronokinase